MCKDSLEKKVSVITDYITLFREAFGIVASYRKHFATLHTEYIFSRRFFVTIPAQFSDNSATKDVSSITTEATYSDF